MSHLFNSLCRTDARPGNLPGVRKPRMTEETVRESSWQCDETRPGRRSESWGNALGNSVLSSRRNAKSHINDSCQGLPLRGVISRQPKYRATAHERPTGIGFRARGMTSSERSLPGFKLEPHPACFSSFETSNIGPRPINSARGTHGGRLRSVPLKRSQPLCSQHFSFFFFLLFLGLSCICRANSLYYYTIYKRY